MVREAEFLAEKIVAGHSKTVLYGGGKTGKQAYDFLKSNEIPVYAFCDSNPALWGYEITDRVVCLRLEDLLCIAQEVVFIITAAHRYYADIIRRLKSYEGVNYIIWEEFSSSIAAKRWIYGTNKIYNYPTKKAAIYTCITNGYDKFEEQKVIIPGCDYFVISDQEIEGNKNTESICINEVVPDNIKDPKLQNRYCKMHGHTIFKDYRYSIYLDGTIEILQDISDYLDLTNESGVAFYKHEVRDCIYDEGMAVMFLNKADPKQVKMQLKGYAETGMPARFGLLAGGAIFRNHKKSLGNQIMESWWKEYVKWPTRDQISLMYILWSMGIGVSDIGIVSEGKSCLQDSKIILREHIGIDEVKA